MIPWQPDRVETTVQLDAVGQASACSSATADYHSRQSSDSSCLAQDVHTSGRSPLVVAVVRFVSLSLLNAALQGPFSAATRRREQGSKEQAGSRWLRGREARFGRAWAHREESYQFTRTDNKNAWWSSLAPASLLLRQLFLWAKRLPYEL